MHALSVEIKPQILRGPWASGFALHVHSLSSNYLGDDQWGHARYSTTRSPVGELLYQLKYRQDKNAVDQLAEAAAGFCKKTWQLKVDAIVPVPHRRRGGCNPFSQSLPPWLNCLVFP